MGPSPQVLGGQARRLVWGLQGAGPVVVMDMAQPMASGARNVARATAEVSSPPSASEFEFQWPHAQLTLVHSGAPGAQLNT